VILLSFDSITAGNAPNAGRSASSIGTSCVVAAPVTPIVAAACG
jgi:hypothetical protein